MRPLAQLPRIVLGNTLDLPRDLGQVAVRIAVNDLIVAVVAIHAAAEDLVAGLVPLLVVSAVEEQERLDFRERSLGGEIFFQVLGHTGRIEAGLGFRDPPHSGAVIAVAPAAEAVGGQLRAVGAPPEEMAASDQVHAPPEQNALGAEARKQLRHLRIVAELVAEDARRRGPAAQTANQFTPHAKVPQERFAADEEFVGHDIPGTRGDLSFAEELFDLPPPLGPDFEVIFQHDGLAVGCERARQPAVGQSVEHLIEELHPAIAEVLERQVPFPVPMRAEDVILARRRLFVMDL